MEKYVIVVAGGKGLRMGTEIPKQFLLLRGKPVLMHTLEAFYNYDRAIHIIVVLPEEGQAYWQTLCEQYKFTIKHLIVNGGETRFHSVKNGLDCVKEKQSLVAIHDGVRPAVSKELIANAFDAAGKYNSAYPVIPVSDSLRKFMPGGETILVDRSEYVLVQTPQVFASELIIDAYQGGYCGEFTDDVSVYEARRHCKAHSIEGRKENIKITTPVDLVLVEAILWS
ncbi:MAG: 2-C-methyl-D-erythritol 4-phosphate cytidylyltransferase [Candidatus Symbiothrix sp.]|jgi:2-C-methyl-D-erythritol 4-phosphate cytidylyltransferase|nr:2-C-methyl-D-erythritol 4-phosphate cytidylyltransferase [Candidatus Symbiothrix sp.]